MRKVAVGLVLSGYDEGIWGLRSKNWDREEGFWELASESTRSLGPATVSSGGAWAHPPLPLPLPHTPFSGSQPRPLPSTLHSHFPGWERSLRFPL